MSDTKAFIRGGGIVLPMGVAIDTPNAGEAVLSSDGDGNPQVKLPDGSTAPIGGGGVADGVTIEGTGTSLDPFAGIPASASNAGTMSAADKTKLDGLAANGWTVITLNSNAQDQDITFTGENGGTIEVEVYVKNASAGAATYSIHPNAVSTNQKYLEVYGVFGNVTAAEADGTSLVVGFCSASHEGAFSFRMTTKTGVPRIYWGRYQYFGASNALSGASSTAGVWNETATAITSLRIHADQTTGLGSGTIIRWRQVPDGS